MSGIGNSLPPATAVAGNSLVPGQEGTAPVFSNPVPEPVIVLNGTAKKGRCYSN
jgi:hypothetical protein